MKERRWGGKHEANVYIIMKLLRRRHHSVLLRFVRTGLSRSVGQRLCQSINLAELMIELCWIKERPHIESYLSAVSKLWRWEHWRLSSGLYDSCNVSTPSLEWNVNSPCGLREWLLSCRCQLLVRQVLESLHLMSIDSMSEEKVFNLLCNLLFQLLWSFAE